MSQNKEKQSSQLPLPQRGDDNDRQDPLNTAMWQRPWQNKKKWLFKIKKKKKKKKKLLARMKVP